MRNEVEETRSEVNRSKMTNREEAAIAVMERDCNYQCILYERDIGHCFF